MLGKRGIDESATSPAAGVILIIGLLVVIYLIALPEDLREDILEGEDVDLDDYDFANGGSDTSDDEDDNGKDKETLIFRNPGMLIPSGIEDEEKEFASANLFVTTETERRKLANSLTVSSSLFGKKTEEVEFTVDNKAGLERLNLYFNIREAKGDLIIYLNGRIVFDGAVNVNDLPLEIPVTNLRAKNRLKFKASDVGYAFLSKNKYSLKDIELVKEFNLEHKQELRKFEISRAESLKDAELRFFVNCLELNIDQGVLKVYLNRKNVFFGKVVCDASQVKFDISEDDFIDGTNYLTFEVDKGDYVIEQIRLDYEFDEGVHPLYFFTIDEDQFEDIEDKDIEIKLKLTFDNDEDRKRADIRLNDRTIYLDVNDDTFKKDITNLVKEGENFIKIFAKNEFEIVQLEVYLLE